MNKICLLAPLIFSFQLNGIEERDWINDWPDGEIPGTENLRAIDPDEIGNYSSIAVTYALDGGRFGDQLTNYLKALWISWKYKTPLLFRPFDLSNQLMLSDYHDTHLDEKAIEACSAKLEYFYFLDLEKTRKVFAYLDSLADHEDKSCILLWNIGLLTPFIEEHFCEKMDDEEFRVLLQKWVQPKYPLNKVALFPDRKNVALHVRTGVGYDLEVNIRSMPTKFPPLTFYLSALKQVAGNDPLYIHIFTDHPNPETLEDKLKKQLKLWEIENDILFGYRKVGNHHSQNILEDLFSMMEFDCLIHPDSSISRLAATVTAPTVEIKPSHWGEYRLDDKGAALLDKEGNFIIDPLFIEREGRGKPIKRMQLVPIPEARLF